MVALCLTNIYFFVRPKVEFVLISNEVFHYIKYIFNQLFLKTFLRVLFEFYFFEGVKTIFAGSSCNDLVTIHGTNILSGHFDKRVRFWDSRTDSSTNEILLQGRLTSLDLSPGTLLLSVYHSQERMFKESGDFINSMEFNLNWGFNGKCVGLFTLIMIILEICTRWICITLAEIVDFQIK